MAPGWPLPRRREPPATPFGPSRGDVGASERARRRPAARLGCEPGAVSSGRRSALLLGLAGHLLQLSLAHPGLGLLALTLARELGAHELALLLGLGRHSAPPGEPTLRAACRRRIAARRVTYRSAGEIASPPSKLRWSTTPDKTPSRSCPRSRRA